MKCHYDVLEISRDADDSTIKTAYRKLALKWHPDKNLNNLETAKEQFQLVQQAYEILSDKSERAWYDNHREQILHRQRGEFQDNCLDVFQYFTTTCFKGYEDDEGGFYSVYRGVFEKIMHEEIEYMEDKEELLGYPVFGTSTSDYQEVVGPFYAHWMSFSTRKTYVWLDPYNSTEMRDRKVYKLMEKENKKVRQKAKKERNEEIRNLVAFVRKRDRRVQEYSKKLEIKVLENRKKQEELSKQKRLERKKQLNESTVEAEWTKFDNVSSELEEIEKQIAKQFDEQILNDESDEEVNNDSLYCIACNKIFKTPKSFENHESSKKHKDNIERLKVTMLDDEHSWEDCTSDDIAESDDTEQEVAQKKKQKKAKNVIKLNLSDEDLNEFETLKHEERKDSDNGFQDETVKKRKQKNKKTKNVNKSIASEVSTVDDVKSDEEHEDLIKHKGKSNKTKDCKKPKAKPTKVNNSVNKSVELDPTRYCAMCKANFSSKNKLFDHLKKTGHSVLLQKI